MNKEQIKNHTIMFVFIIAFIIMFGKIFGEQNILIGVTIITAALMFLERDLTISPFKYLIALTCFNLFLGLAAFLAGLNTWIGIPINFTALFMIGFLFCYDLKSNLFIPFGLQYIFMLSAPVGFADLGVRLLSLVVGSILILLMHISFNKNKLEKAASKITANISDALLEKIELIKTEEDINDADYRIKKKIMDLKKMIADRRKKSYYLTEAGRINLRILAIFEDINERLNNLDKTYTQADKMNILQEVHADLTNIRHQTKEANKAKPLTNIIFKSTDKDISEQLELLFNYYSQLASLENPNKIIKTRKIPEIFTTFEVAKRNLKFNTVRFSYALRLGLCVSLAIFIMDYFKIYEARWMVYTVFALIQPYYEDSKVRSRKRFRGTLLGGMIAGVLFSVFHSPLMKTAIIGLAGYLDGFTKSYDQKIICITVCALGAASITANIGGQLFFRLLFLCLAIIVAYIANKLILPYSLEKANNDLMIMGDSVIDYINREFKLYKKGENNYHTIENLYIIASLIENKLIINNSKDSSKFASKKEKKVDRIYHKSVLLENK